MPIWSGGLKRYTRAKALTLKASGAETASTTGASKELGDAGSMQLKCDVTAFAGTTPTLSVKIAGSDDDTDYFTIGTFFNGGFQFAGVAAGTNITGTVTLFAVVPAARFVRYDSVIGGSAGQSFTYAVTGKSYGNH